MDKRDGARCSLLGSLSAFYLAVSYLLGIIIFLLILKYPEITTSLEKVKVLHDYASIVFITNILMYVLFGPIFILFILSIKRKFAEEKSDLLTFSTVIGYIWAGSLVASGMISNAAIAPVLSLYDGEIDRAAYMWQIFDTIAIGIGNGNGEILGGLFTLLLSVFTLTAKRLNKFVSIWGIAVGIIGIVSVIPQLNDFTGLFGLTQMIWFVFVGVSFLAPRIGDA